MTASFKSPLLTWTENEDQLLCQVVTKDLEQDWIKISEVISTKTLDHCKERWDYIVSTTAKKKGYWSSEEDQALRKCVEIFGTRNWSEISKRIPGRAGKQCRERYKNHLVPNIKKDPWSEEEDGILLTQQSQLGNRWATIANFLPGRSENMIKNRFNSLKRTGRRKKRKRVSITPESVDITIKNTPNHLTKSNLLQTDEKLQDTIEQESSNNNQIVNTRNEKQSSATETSTGDSLDTTFLDYDNLEQDLFEILPCIKLSVPMLHSETHLRSPSTFSVLAHLLSLSEPPAKRFCPETKRQAEYSYDYIEELELPYQNIPSPSLIPSPQDMLLEYPDLPNLGPVYKPLSISPLTTTETLDD